MYSGERKFGTGAFSPDRLHLKIHLMGLVSMQLARRARAQGNCRATTLARQLPVKSSTAALGSNRKPSTEEFEADQTNTQQGSRYAAIRHSLEITAGRKAEHPVRIG